MLKIVSQLALLHLDSYICTYLSHHIQDTQIHWMTGKVVFM